MHVYLYTVYILDDYNNYYLYHFYITLAEYSFSRYIGNKWQCKMNTRDYVNNYNHALCTHIQSTVDDTVLN